MRFAFATFPPARAVRGPRSAGHSAGAGTSAAILRSLGANAAPGTWAGRRGGAWPWLKAEGAWHLLLVGVVACYFLAVCLGSSARARPELERCQRKQDSNPEPAQTF